MQTRMPERAAARQLPDPGGHSAAEYAGFDRVLVPCAFSNSTYSLAAPYVDSYTLGTAAMGATRNDGGAGRPPAGLHQSGRLRPDVRHG